MKTETEERKFEIASVLQDAYWYADEAQGRSSGMTKTKGEALRSSFRAARKAGLVLSTMLFPRTLASARALQDAIVRYGREQGVVAARGWVLPEMVPGRLYYDEDSGLVVTLARVEGDVAHVVLGGDLARTAPLVDLRPFVPETNHHHALQAEKQGVVVGAPVSQRCSSCQQFISGDDVREFRANGGVGYPDACTDCAEAAAADRKFAGPSAVVSELRDAPIPAHRCAAGPNDPSCCATCGGRVVARHADTTTFVPAPRAAGEKIPAPPSDWPNGGEKPEWVRAFQKGNRS